MTTLEKVAIAISGAPYVSVNSLRKARAAIESLRTPGIEHTDRIFNVMLDRILKEEV